MSFTELRLAEPVLRAVATEGYTTPTPIQALAIPEALQGNDVLGCAQTGTGKTCAFALPILHRLSGLGEQVAPRKVAYGRAPRALVLCPTRELASQIFDSFVAYGRHLSLRHTVVYGGVGQGRQVQAMRNGVDVLVATPGRLLDLINQGHIDLRKIEILVLDEADRMLDMGFMPDIRKIVDMLPEERQTLFFSATMSAPIRKLADTILNNPVSVQTARESATADAIAQRVYMVERRNKPQLLENLLGDGEIARTLVFTRTKFGADRLVKYLRSASIHADAIHGNKSQNARTKTMRAFKSGSTRVLVATDIASRGIDVDDITHVVNFDMPIDAETYVHRIGRTARAGASGVALSFCDRDERGVLRAIERRTQIQLEVVRDLPEFAPSSGLPKGTDDSSGTPSRPRPARAYGPPRQKHNRQQDGPSQGPPRSRGARPGGRSSRPAKGGPSRRSSRVG